MKIFLHLFEADEIAFDIKYVVFIEGGFLNFKLTSLKFYK